MNEAIYTGAAICTVSIVMMSSVELSNAGALGFLIALSGAAWDMMTNIRRML